MVDYIRGDIYRIVAVPPTELGDYSHNGVVDLPDYTVWRNSLGQTGPGLAADGNGDNMVDAADYAHWKSNFGTITAGAGSNAGSSAVGVPEPATLAFLVLGGIIGFFRRRRSLAVARRLEGSRAMPTPARGGFAKFVVGTSHFSPSPGYESASCPAFAAEFVIHISVDGLNPQWMQQVIDAGKAPTLKRLQAESAWTANARTDYTHTITLPNHTSMLTGRPVLQPDGMPPTVFHGWTINDVPDARRDAAQHRQSARQIHRQHVRRRPRRRPLHGALTSRRTSSSSTIRATTKRPEPRIPTAATRSTSISLRTMGRRPTPTA